MYDQDSAGWTPHSWRAFPVDQQPVWPDVQIRDSTLSTLARLPALVFAGESRALEYGLAQAAEGNAFVLQAGDCAEEFSRCHGPSIHDLLKVILQMSMILTYAGEKNVLRVARIAGQYAKPRSSDTEELGGRAVPSYRGDMVNGFEPTLEARTPDPRRMLEGYFRAAATLNLIRAFTTGGYAALDQARAWNEVSGQALSASPKYQDMVVGIDKAISFMTALGIDPESSQLNQVPLYTCHEALLLEYEEAFARVDTTTGHWYDSSANMLWVGDRTRRPDGAHVEFLRGVCNPLGVKIGLDHNLEDIRRIVAALNPFNRPGRLSLITRFGAERIGDRLPPLIRAMEHEGSKIVWICDPMHGNTFVGPTGQKTRRYEDILKEVQRFWQIHQAEGTVAAGVHLELTGDTVMECTGGDLRHDDTQADRRSLCDPRLNPEQAVALAFEIAQLVDSRERLPRTSPDQDHLE
jgi:3-deoxy-7-phosphoheptulonate synthase